MPSRRQRRRAERLRRARPLPDTTQVTSSSASHPLTPQMIATLEEEADAAWRTGNGQLVIIVIVAGALVILGLAFLGGCDPTFVLLTAALLALIAKIASKRKETPLRADIAGGVYLQVSGPITYHRLIWEGEEGGAGEDFFRVDSEDFPITWQTWYEIRSTPWGVVDYAPHSRRIFALRDQSGTVVYSG